MSKNSIWPMQRGPAGVAALRTREQRVSVLLVVACVRHSVACGLEDVVEELAAPLAVLHRVVALHRHQEGNQVWDGDGDIDRRVYAEKQGRQSRETGPEPG